MTARTPTTARSIPTPIRSVPSSAPYEAMAVSQQTHIDDLVQKNRTLDHVAKKLKDELILEQSRSKEAAKAIKSQWQVESAEWREGCDSLQACHRIAHLRTLVELDKERLAVVKEKDVARQERVARLQRDYRITMFQVRESELEEMMKELADEIAGMKEKAEEDTNALVTQYQEAAEKLRVKCAQFAAEAAEKAKELAVAQKDKDKVEAKFSKLREEHAELTASSASATAKLERTALQRDGAQSEIVELERLNDELKRNNAELKRQMDKWQNLETKGGAEVDTLRKRRIELEVQVKEFEGRLADADKTEQEREKTLEKEKRKVEKLKGVIDSWREEAQTSKESAAERESEAADAKKQLAKAEKQIDKLKSQLETERKKAKSTKGAPPPPNEETSESETEPLGPSEEEVEKEIVKPPARKSRPKPKPAYRDSKDAPSDSEDKHTKKAGPSGANRKHGRDDNDSEAEEVGMSEKAKGKRKARDESDVDQPTDKKSGRKATAGVEAASSKPRSRGAARAGSEISEVAKPKKAKSTSRAEPKAPPDDNDSVDDDSAPKKKKRKINIFPTSQPTSFPWGQLSQGDGVNGLNIPTELSPVKDDNSDVVPQRSMFGKVSSLLSFGSR